MKKKILAILSASVVALSSLALPVSTFAASDTQSMYRMYNWNSGEHFYTASVKERNHLVNVGWSYEGIGWTAPKNGLPVYRLYNPYAGDHHYTTSSSERRYLINRGWRSEGVGWRSGGNVPLYRQYNPNAKTGTHNYTTSKVENDSLVRLGWQAEGIAWFADKTERGNSKYPDGIYFATVHNPYLEETPEFQINRMSISDGIMTVSGSFERMNSEHDPIGTIKGDDLEFSLRNDTLFYHQQEENALIIMEPKEYARQITNGDIGPALNIRVQNGFVVEVSSGS